MAEATRRMELPVGRAGRRGKRRGLFLDVLKGDSESADGYLGSVIQEAANLSGDVNWESQADR